MSPPDETLKSLVQLWEDSHIIIGFIYDEKSKELIESGYLPASKIKSPKSKDSVDPPNPTQKITKFNFQKIACCSNPNCVLTGLGWYFCTNCGTRAR